MVQAGRQRPCKLNEALGLSDLVFAKGTLFPLSQRKERKGSLFLTEIRAGIAAFFAMAYILAVNASILTDSGGSSFASILRITPTLG